MLTNKQRFSEKTFHRFFRGRDSMKGNEGNSLLKYKTADRPEASKWYRPRRMKHCIFTSDATLRESPKARHGNLSNRGKLLKSTLFQMRSPRTPRAKTLVPARCARRSSTADPQRVALQHFHFWSIQSNHFRRPTTSPWLGTPAVRVLVPSQRQLRHAQYPVHRRADLVAHVGQELTL
jgi:hypothetical protein